MASKKLSQLRRSSQLLLFGDDGSTKPKWNQDSQPPAASMITDVTLFPPNPASGWSGYNPEKQPAIRHDSTTRAVFVNCDGHVEKWKWRELRDNLNDMFGSTPTEAVGQKIQKEKRQGTPMASIPNGGEEWRPRTVSRCTVTKPAAGFFRRLFPAYYLWVFSKSSWVIDFPPCPPFVAAQNQSLILSANNLPLLLRQKNPKS